MMPPFAGQGMNSGMRDAGNLAWKLAAVLRGAADAAILDTYEPERAPSVRTMVNLSRNLGAVIMPTRPMIARLRDAIFAGVSRSRRADNFIRRGGILPKPEIGRSALSPGRRDGIAGAMLPQPVVSCGVESAPLDRWIGYGRWCALGIGVDPTVNICPQDLVALRALDAAFLRLDPQGAAGETGLRVDDGAFLDWVRRRNAQSLLVRPDRFIAERIVKGRPLRSLAALAPSVAGRRDHPVAKTLFAN